MTRSLSQIIDLLGGWHAVAKEFGFGQSAISNWKARGVPPGRWLALERFAAKQRPRIEPPITAEEIEAASAKTNAEKAAA